MVVICYAVYIQVWNSHHLFENSKVAEDFLGVLDTVFMFAYAAVSSS